MVLGLDDVRDIVIIAAGSVMFLLLLTMLVVTVVLGVSVRMLLGTVRGLVNNEVKPMAHSARETVDNVRGTTSFVNEAIAKPIIRIYGFVAALRRVLTVLLGFAGRRQRPG
ncbi:MAG: hypothetical protein WBD55_08650 [Dehalococcoidia bacterium]